MAGSKSKASGDIRSVQRPFCTQYSRDMAGKSDPAMDHTAAIIVIGDEILKGHVQDTNSHFLCKGLWGRGVKVLKVVVLPDDLDVITNEVRASAPLYDFVLTTGGVGPTHDDITMEAVGRAFSEPLAPHPDILRFIFPSDPHSPAHMSHPWSKMAIVPTSTKLFIPPSHKDFSFLLMMVHNVHCYPGVPSLCEDIFTHSKALYGGSNSFSLKEVFFSCGEDVLARPLTRIQHDYPTVQLGSYPAVSSADAHRVRVALESKDRRMVEEAFSKLVLSVPAATMMSSRCSYTEHLSSSTAEHREFVAKALTLSQARSTLLPDSLCSRIHDSMQILEKALDEYSLGGMCVAFNGGKDCTVILALLRALLTQRGLIKATSTIHVLHVVENEQFPEIEDFVLSSVKHFGLKVIRVSGGIKYALSGLKSSHPDLKAICMGTRRTDPHSADLEAFSMTDKSWPEYMRINSILEWTYQDIWLFLRLFEIPYCTLYDQGYTSLDGMLDTHPNPSLCTSLQSSPCADSTYLPAYMLTDEGLERAGRTNRSANL